MCKLLGLEAHYRLFGFQSGVDSVSLLEEIEDLMKSAVLPFMCSSNFKLMCSRVKLVSVVVTESVFIICLSFLPFADLDMMK